MLAAAAALPLASASQVLRRIEPAPNTAQSAQPPAPRIGRALVSTMLPAGMSWKERFDLAHAVGFDGVEVAAVESPAERDEIMRAAEGAHLTIHAVVSAAPEQFALSSGDPEVVKKGVVALKTALTVASLWKAEEVLITPAVVDAATSYGDAWARSQTVIREQLLPLAAGFKVHVGLAVPGDRFLLSPLECARYIDELRSAWVKASIDVGQAVVVGYPQDWIRTLGRRVTRLRLRDCHVDRAHGRFEWKNIGDGNIDWQQVRKSMSETPYVSWVTVDLEPGDRAYLANVLARMDKFLAGFRPASAAPA